MFQSARAWLVLLVVLAGCGSDDDDAKEDDNNVLCTLELRLPISVRVTSPEGLPITSVTATNERIEKCSNFGWEDAGDAVVFHCAEQGGGTYRVRVASRQLGWSKSVDLNADECHVLSRVKLDFVLEEATAD